MPPALPATGNGKPQVSVRTLLHQRALLRASAAIAEAHAIAPASGWISAAEWTNDTGTPVTSFESSWIVPAPPTAQAQQIIYLFNSLEIDTVRILQPVLLWGNVSDVPGTGSYWTISSWWVGEPTDPFLLTPPVRVNPGEKLTGRITMYQQEQSLFDYTCEFVGKPGTKMIVGGLPEFKKCTETLEAYYVTSDDQYPATSQTSFTSIVVQTGGASIQPAWTPGAWPFKPNIVQTPGGTEIQIGYPSGEA